MTVQATIVFEKNWEAIHARNPDGSRKYRYIINEGASRSSKTRSLIQLYYLYALKNEGKRLSAWRDTKKDCKDTVLADMKEAFPAMPNFFETVTFNKTESIFTFPNASTIEICGTDEPNRVHGYNGHVAWLNEPYDISRDTFDQIDMRTADVVVIDWNPKQAHWVEDLKKDPRALVVHSTFRDNPFCPPEQRTKILSYQPLSMCQVVEEEIMTEPEAKIYNLTENPLALSEKQIEEISRCRENERKRSASRFNWMVYGLGLKSEKPNRIFSWEEIPDDEYHAISTDRYFGVDWGTVDPWGIVEVKYYDGGLYLHELNYRSENQIREGLLPTEREQMDGMDEGLVRWMFERLGIPKNRPIICDDNRPLKVRALRVAGWDYAITATKGEGSVIEGINLLEGLKVYYTASSTNLAHEQENYERKVDRYKIVTEEPEDRDNHLIDPTRYVATFLRLNGIIKAI